jgi:serine/threonine protein kinase
VGEKLKISSALDRDLPGYRIESVLGSGATSTVYKAIQTSLGRYVAIKRFDPATFLPQSISERFEREAAIWSHLSHENLIHLYDYRLSDIARYIILEYCQGVELREAADRVITFPATVVASVALQILSALEYLHRFGIVHRDLKPANIFLTNQGVVKVMDFGISLCPELEPITAPGQVLGTPAYMSPEQALGKELDARTDFFSMGVILYQLLEGVKPFKPSSFEEMAKEKDYWRYKKLTRRHPATLRNLIHTCLEQKLKKRNVSIPKQRQLLETYLDRERIRFPREHLQEFLLHRRLVSEADTLFPMAAIKETTMGPLGTTFARMLSGGDRHRFSLRPWLLAVLMFGLLGGLYYGPPFLRPEWKTLGSFLLSLSQKFF